VRVEICDNNKPVGSEVLATAQTDDSGLYSVTTTIGGASVDLVVRARSESPSAKVQAPGITLSYILQSDVANQAKPGAAITLNISGDSAKTNNAAFSVLDATLGARQFVQKVAQYDMPKVPVEFPAGGNASYFEEGMLHILVGDRWDWDVIMHEYGHYVSTAFGLDESPGGAHYLDENIAERLRKRDAIRLAWGEGWPTFFSIVAQREMKMEAMGIPYVGDTHYTDSADANIDIDLASTGDGSMGEDNEVSVMRMLFEAVTGDGAATTPAGMWGILAQRKPVTLSDAWQAITTRLNGTAFSNLGVVASRHHVAPSPSSPDDGMFQSSMPPQFGWNSNGGGPHYRNNQFKVRFLSKEWQTLNESDSVSNPNFQPTSTAWTSLTGQELFYWVVSGTNTEEPITGPYVSVARKILKPASPSPAEKEH
jgi:hypothetical protein